jgi:hypothetical protein
MNLQRIRFRFGILVCLTGSLSLAKEREGHKKSDPRFQLSERCVACHNRLTTPSGEDVSIGFEWRASIMANSSRDPYWQASVRRESIDHPESKAAIEDECSICHMPMARYESKLRGVTGQVFSHLTANSDKEADKQALDGVSCSVCHQISKENLGTRESFNGGFIVDAPDGKNPSPEYGPFDIERGQKRIMQTSSAGFQPNKSEHIKKSEVCATCHTLYTKSLGPGGAEVGTLPEQMPYQEWLHSDFKDKQSCQSCHMPVVKEQVPVTNVLGVPRDGFSRHVFVAANFFMQRMLNRFRDDLDVIAEPKELTAAADRTVNYLQSQAASIAIDRIHQASGRLEADVVVVNLGGHKLPTAYPARRAWLHFTVRDRADRVIFESGGLNADGSIQGNDNDAEASRYEPHYSEISRPDQVQIYEAVLKDSKGNVTTGLLSAIGFLKDNRLLPKGFDKSTADHDVAVCGDAAGDAGFTDAGHRVRYSVDIGRAPGPFRIQAELVYQPIGFRWANNLKPYNAAEPRRFTRYYDAMSNASAVTLVHTNAVN